MNIKNVKNRKEIYSYSDLTDLAKAKARNEVIQREIEALNKKIADFKNKVKVNIHFGINDKYSFSSFVRSKKLVNKLKSDLLYTEKFISENLCDFLMDGTYITYSI